MLQGVLWGPVVVLETGQKKPAVTYKLVCPDGTHIVVAAVTRELWAGADGRAFDVPRSTVWKIIAAQRPNGVITL